MALKKKQELESYTLLDCVCQDDDFVLLDNTNDEDFVLEIPDPMETLINEIDSDIRARKRVPPKANNSGGTIIPTDFFDKNCVTQRASSNANARMDSVLSDMIGRRTKPKALPLALRKRLMYQQAINAF